MFLHHDESKIRENQIIKDAYAIDFASQFVESKIKNIHKLTNESIEADMALLQAASEGNCSKVKELLDQNDSIIEQHQAELNKVKELFIKRLEHRKQTAEETSFFLNNLFASQEYKKLNNDISHFLDRLYTLLVSNSSLQNKDEFRDRQISSLIYQIFRDSMYAKINIDDLDDSEEIKLVYQIIEISLKRGAYIDITEEYIPRWHRQDPRSYSNYTPLMNATLKGHLEMVKLLVSRGANIHSSDAWRYDSLTFACSKGHEDIAIFLVNAGASINGKCGWNIRKAAEHNLINLAKLLIEKGIDINEREQLKYGGRVPLAYAAANNNIEIMHILLDHGADVNGEEGCKSPLYEAFRNNHEDAIKILLAWHADTNQRKGNSRRKNVPLIRIPKHEDYDSEYESEEFEDDEEPQRKKSNNILILPIISSYAHKILRNALTANSPREISKEEKLFMTEIVSLLFEKKLLDEIIAQLDEIDNFTLKDEKDMLNDTLEDLKHIENSKGDTKETVIFNAVKQVIIEIAASHEIKVLENHKVSLPVNMVYEIRGFHSTTDTNLYKYLDHITTVLNQFTKDEVKNVLDDICNRVEEKYTQRENQQMAQESSSQPNDHNSSTSTTTQILITETNNQDHSFSK